MSDSGMTITGKFFDGEVPLPVNAELTFYTSEIGLTVGDESLFYDMSNLKVSPRIGHAERFIQFTDGSQFQCTDQPFFDALPQEVKSEGLVAWLEKRAYIAVFSVAIIVITILFGYIYGLPVVAKSVADRIPIDTEVMLSDHVLAWIDQNNLFDYSHVDTVKQKSITNKFRVLHEGFLISPHIKVEFRNSKQIGPNALAFPGGVIVITDSMVNIAQSDDEILAILAHELGHLHYRHGLQHIIQSSLVALAVVAITNDASTLNTIVAGLPLALINASYSREFEEEADKFALDLLKQHNIPIEAFAKILERLNKTNEQSILFSFLSTHPITSERIKMAREFDKEMIINNQALPADRKAESKKLVPSR